VLTGFFGGNAEVDSSVKAAIGKLKSQGATAVPVDLGAQYSTLWNDVLGPVGDMEFSSEFAKYLSTEPAGTIKSVSDLVSISSSAGVAASSTPVNPARIGGFEAAEAAAPQMGSAKYLNITGTVMPALRQHVEDVMKAEKLDALVFPTMSCVASPRFDQPDPTYSCKADDPYAASYISSATGLPEVTIPVGADSQGLPIGMSFLGKAYDEQTILNLADSWETADGPHLTPKTVSH
jgi:amidase